MNQAHLHLLLNHAPIMGAAIGLMVLIAGLLTGNESVKRTAFGIFIGAALIVIPTHITGEGAEHLIESIPGSDHKLIHAHGRAVGLFQWVMAALGILSAAALFSPLQKMDWIKWIVLVLALVAMYGAQQAGTSGGAISHPEVRPGFVAPPQGERGEERD